MIYGLVNKDGGQIRYVGRTSLSESKRKSLHAHRAKKNIDESPKGQWIRRVGLDGFDIIVLEDETKDAIESEKFWIQYLEFLGSDLLNVTEGGNGNTKGGGIEITEKMESMMGKVPDQKIANEFGIDRKTVQKHRTRIGISPVQPNNLSSKKVSQVKWMLENTNKSQREIANSCDVGQASVSRINRKETYSDVTGQL